MLFDSIVQDHFNAVNEVVKLKNDIFAASELIIKTLKSSKKILIMGNGGSAADAQHWAAELVGRFKTERKALPALALTTDSSIITSISNDYNYNIIFSRQIEALAAPGDLVIGISTSGNSVNVIEGIKAAKGIDCSTLALLGRDGGLLNTLVDISLVIKVEDTARIQEAHLMIYHILCQLVDEAFHE